MLKLWGSLSVMGQRLAVGAIAALLLFFAGWISWDHIARALRGDGGLPVVDDSSGPTLGDLGEDAIRIQEYVFCLKKAMPIEDRRKRMQEAMKCEDI